MAWSDAARAAATMARQARKRGKAYRPSKATQAAMLKGEIRNPSSALVGRPRPGMVEASPGVYQRRDEFAKTLKAARAEVRKRSTEVGARNRNVHARVIAGRTVQASIRKVLGGRR